MTGLTSSNGEKRMIAKMDDKKLLIERLERLAIVLDELMPGCAELVRDAIAMLKEQEAEIERLRKPTAGDNHIPLRW